MRKRITEAEGVRGILSLIVVAVHINDAPLFWVSGCMDVFFCISGFLITRGMLSNHDKPGFFRAYFIRRALRIWPMYYFGMVFTYIVLILTYDQVLAPLGLWSGWEPSTAGAIMPLFFLQNTELYFGVERFSYPLMFDHSWSVALEEQFYLLWPLIFVFLMPRLSTLARLLLAACCIGISLTLRINADTYLDLWLLPARMDGFILGAALAFIERAVDRGDVRALRISESFKWLWLLPCLALMPFLLKGYFGIRLPIPTSVSKLLLDPIFHFAFLAFCVLGRCVFAGESEREATFLSRVLNLRPLQYLGTISYSTYLLHPAIIFGISPLLISYFGLPPAFEYVLGFGLSIAVAHFGYKLIEMPSMNLKSRFLYTAAKAQPPVLIDVAPVPLRS